MLDEIAGNDDLPSAVSDNNASIALRELVIDVERRAGRAIALRLFSLLEEQDFRSAGVDDILAFLKSHADQAWRTFSLMRDNPFVHAEMGEQARNIYMEMLGRRYEEAAELHRVARNCWRNDSLHLDSRQG